MNCSTLLTRSGRRASQQPRELARFIEVIRGSRSYLEVGARHGDTFYEVMKSLPKGSKGVAIDMPNGPWGGDSKRHLLDAVEELSADYDVTVLFGDSQSITLTETFDAVLIDGDHRYDAVKSDFERFNGKIVGLHDIAGEGVYLKDMPVEVPRLWHELKDQYQYEEIIHQDDERPMGIGVIYK